MVCNTLITSSNLVVASEGITEMWFLFLVGKAVLEQVGTL